MNRRWCVLYAVGLPVAACAPALDWRELRPAGSDVSLLFPCKASQDARQVPLGQRPVQMVLYACRAGGSTWALATAEMHDPARVGPALLELRRAAAGNLGAAKAARELALQVPGATPNPHSARLEIHGRLPDGRNVTEQLAVFARGTQIFQATVLGEQVPPQAADTFFDSLRAGS